MLTELSTALIDSHLEDLFDPIPEPPMDRDDYNRRGRFVAGLIRFVRRRFPTVFWNEVAHARRAAVEGFPEIPVEKVAPL